MRRSWGAAHRASGKPLLLALSAALGMVLAGPVASSAQGGPQARATDGNRYPVSSFGLIYADPHPAFPPVEELLALEVELGQAAGGYVAPRAGFPSTRLRISDVMTRTQFYASAIRAINQQLVFEFNRRDFHALVVAPVQGEIERRSGRDLRPAGQTALTLAVYAGRVRDLKTFAAGERIPENERLDHPAHSRIAANSPVQADGVNDLVRKDQLDAYAARLNRHPGRRVDIEISSGREAGAVNLDYMIAENRPWYVTLQISNTGTEETAEWRQRFGFTHTQLTGNDDILRLDYVTGNFDEVHAVVGSYELPIPGTEWLRARVFGS